MRVDQESMLGSGEGQGLGSRPQPALRAQSPRAQSACDREVGPGEGEGKRAKDGMRGPNKAGACLERMAGRGCVHCHSCSLLGAGGEGPVATWEAGQPLSPLLGSGQGWGGKGELQDEGLRGRWQK